MNKKILLSGIKATGALHIGNYFGAMKQNIELSNNADYESFVFIADYHSLTTVKNGDELRKNTFDLACAYLACGLDPKKVALFKQSDIPEHTELCWVFNNVVTVPYLMRAHAFKDHEAKNKEVNIGLFDYPVLMAADILMYQADIVPVGQDQKQHIEYARDIAGYFNRAWNKEYFKLPQEYIKEEVAIVPGIDGQKMAKSKGNTIPLFGTDEEIKKVIMKIVTDSKTPEEIKDPETDNIFAIHKLFQDKETLQHLKTRYVSGTISYKESKEMLATKIIEVVAPWREKYEYYQSHPDEVYLILQEGKMKAKAKANNTMTEVRRLIGLTK